MIKSKLKAEKDFTSIPMGGFFYNHILRFVPDCALWVWETYPELSGDNKVLRITRTGKIQWNQQLTSKSIISFLQLKALHKLTPATNGKDR